VVLWPLVRYVGVTWLRSKSCEKRRVRITSELLKKQRPLGSYHGVVCIVESC
jgi:hypothetical protein